MTFGGINRSDYPTLNPVSKEASGAVLTREMLENFFDRMTSPEYLAGLREAKQREFALMDEMNRRLKENWAAKLGKSVDELTKEDMDALNEACFQSWLKYKGITEQEFWDWIG